VNSKSITKLVLTLILVAPLLLQVSCGGGGGGGEETTTSVSGRLVSTDGRGLAGVYVEATATVRKDIYGCSTENVSLGTQTDDNGYYRIVTQESGVSGGDVSIEPTQYDLVFEPAIANLFLNYGDHVKGVDFTGYQLFDLNGTINSNFDADLSGITIIADNDGTQTSSQTTANGSFNIYRLKEGRYEITPSSPYFDFDPQQHLISSSGTDVANVIFWALPKRHEVSGTILSRDLNQGLAGVTVYLSGATSAQTVTDQEGSFVFSGLVRGQYQVTPSLVGYTFGPENNEFWIDLDDHPGVDFAAYYSPITLSGQVVDESGFALPKVTVDIAGPVMSSTSTNEFGDYSIPNLILGDYILTPSSVCSYFDFYPSERQLSLTGTDLTDLNFVANRSDTGLYMISGRVVDKDGNGLIGIPILLDGIATATTSTDSLGDYQFSGLMIGPYTVEVETSLLNLSPLRHEINLCAADAGEKDFHEIATWNRYGYLSAKAVAVHEAPDDNYVVALTGSDIRVIKVNGLGAPLWLKSYAGDQNETATTITKVDDGGSVVAGRVQYLGTNYQEGLLLKLGSTGDLLWANSYKGTDSLSINSVMETIDGGYLVTGYLRATSSDIAGVLLKLDSTGAILWQYEFPSLVLQHVMATGDGGFAAVGENVFIKLTATGELTWAKSYDFGVWEPSFFRILSPSANNYFLVGNVTNYTVSPSDNDHLAIKIDQVGNVLWGNRIGTVATNSYSGEGFSDAELSSSNGIFYAGTRRYDADNSGARLFELDPDGNVLWFKDRGSSISTHRIESLAPVGGNQFFGAGYYEWSFYGAQYTLELAKLDDGEDSCTSYGTYTLNTNPLSGVVSDYSLSTVAPGQLSFSSVDLNVTDQTFAVTEEGTCQGI
jgi:hypothetical protein